MKPSDKYWYEPVVGDIDKETLLNYNMYPCPTDNDGFESHLMHLFVNGLFGILSGTDESCLNEMSLSVYRNQCSVDQLPHPMDGDVNLLNRLCKMTILPARFLIREFCHKYFTYQMRTSIIFYQNNHRPHWQFVNIFCLSCFSFDNVLISSCSSRIEFSIHEFYLIKNRLLQHQNNSNKSFKCLQ